MPHSKPFDEGTAPKSLRERALEMSSMSRDRIADMTPEDVQRVVHELQVHQIELQLQNEELRHSQLELARARDRYADLYEFAPDGYVTLNREGTVLEANLTAAKLLGVVRDSLVGKNLTNFISRQSQDCFYLHRQEVFAAGAKQICELEMQRDGGLWMARLATTVRPDEDGVVRQCRAAISDVSQTVERIKGEIQRRFEASPSIFMRAQQSPGISENLWRQAEFAYLDNPLPALFKEMLFAYLSRYCQVPYCMARHSAFLLRVGRVAGDPNVKGMPASEVLAMLEKPFPSADELKDSLAVLRGATALTPWPKAGSALEVAVFRLCVPIYMGLRERIDIHGGSIRSDDVQAELRRVLGDVWYDHLIMLISFIQMAHFWSESHPEIVLDSDVELVLGEQQALANWVGAYQDTVSAELKERVSDELVRLEKRHLELKNSYEALQTSFDVQARRLERAEVETAELGRILEQSLNEIYVVDAESLNFIIVNRGARQNLGYSMDELCYLTPVDLKPDYTPESYTRLLERLHLGVEKIIIFQTPHRRKDGSTYDAEVHIQVAHFQQRPCFVSIVRDVTKRNRTEQALRHSEARMKAILASLSAHIAVVDRVGQIIAVNPAWERFAEEHHGFLDRCGVGANYLEVCRDATGPAAQEAPRVATGLQAILDGRDQEFTLEYELSLQGSTHWFLMQITPLQEIGGGAVISHLDITDRVAAEKALKVQHEFTQRLFDTGQNIVLVLDTEGRIVSFNRYLELLAGWRLDEVKGQSWFDTYVPQSIRAEVRNLFQRALGHERTRGSVNAILTRDGRTLEISWYDAVLSDATGKVTGLLCTGQDVTDWRMLEREVLEISKAEQRRIGHDLHDGVCQELTGLGLLAQGLADQLAAETASVALETAGILNLCEVARRLSEGIGSATSHTRDLSHSLIPAAIDTLGLQISLEELAVSTNSLHDIVCSFECDASIHVADSVAETHLYRIAQEAVANAAKHSEAKNIRIALLKKENRVTLQVQDDGNGRSTVRQDSNGLGQRIMKYRADLIGAQLEIQANEGRGTVVTCRLPQGRVREQ